MSRCDDAVFAAEVHEGKETEQAVVVSIEVSVGKGHVGGMPQTLDKVVSFGVVSGQRRGGERGDETYGMAQSRFAASLVRSFGRHAVDAVLVDVGVDAIVEEEVLHGVGVTALPCRVGAGPTIVLRDVHRHASRVVTEILHPLHRSVARRRERLAVVGGDVGTECRARVDAAVEIAA